MGRVIVWSLALVVGAPTLGYLTFLLLRELARMSPWWDRTLGRVFGPFTRWLHRTLVRLAQPRWRKS